MSKYIDSVVKDIVSSFDTNNPYIIAEELGFFITESELPSSIKGERIVIDYLNETHIVINSSLDEYKKKFVCAHELGHCLLHEESSMFFIQETHEVLGKYEREANEFAVKLLTFNLIYYEHETITKEHIIKETGIPYSMYNLL